MRPLKRIVSLLLIWAMLSTMTGIAELVSEAASEAVDVQPTWEEPEPPSSEELPPESPKAPAPTEAHAPAEAPAPTEAPAATEIPFPTEEPASSDAPKLTAPPAEEPTVQPEVTPEAGATEEPLPFKAGYMELLPGVQIYEIETLDGAFVTLKEPAVV